MSRPRHWQTALVAVTAGAVLLYLALPVLALAVRAMTGTSAVRSVVSPAVLDGLLLSLVTTLVSLLLVAVLGTPLAVLLAHRRLPGRALFETIVDLPIVLPPSVAGLALLLVFGRLGLLGGALAGMGISIPFTTLAVVMAQAFVAAPFFIRSARTGIAGVEREIQDAARVDGAAEPGVFRWVTVPLAAPALAAGLVMSWARALGEFGATIMFAGNVAGQTQTLPLLVYGKFQSTDLDASIAAAAVLVLAAFGALMAVRVLHWGRALDLRGGA
jgi:molybdate transport system permease protein